ncbi:MAG: hypothetical protein M3O70_01065 [Actinomycetota bacterium]|nr:hypothetical protein [Actinomycetota bacterium]
MSQARQFPASGSVEDAGDDVVVATAAALPASPVAMAFSELAVGRGRAGHCPRRPWQLQLE